MYMGSAYGFNSSIHSYIILSIAREMPPTAPPYYLHFVIHVLWTLQKRKKQYYFGRISNISKSLTIFSLNDFVIRPN